MTKNDLNEGGKFNTKFFNSHIFVKMLENGVPLWWYKSGYLNRSKYIPHQGVQECTRRVHQRSRLC